MTELQLQCDLSGVAASKYRLVVAARRPFLRVSGKHVPRVDVFEDGSSWIVACAHEGPATVGWEFYGGSAGDRLGFNVTLGSSASECSSSPNGLRLTMSLYV